MQEQYISLSDLRKVSGIGDKTIERIKEQLLQNELDDNYKSEYNENIKLDVNNIYHGDCLELMNGIPDKSMDMILCDLPYGTTACKWDMIIPFESLWEQYARIIKDNGAIVLTSDEPFTSNLILSNIKNFRYRITWDKVNKLTNFMNAKKMPLKQTEDICIFYKKQPTYNPIMTDSGKPYHYKRTNKGTQTEVYGKNGMTEGYLSISNGERHPTNLLSIKGDFKNKIHPTQKPVELFEWLIKTYTNEGETVLDNCMGSGTTAIACINTNRNYIGIELDEKYYNIAKNRINKHKSSILLK